MNSPIEMAIADKTSQYEHCEVSDAYLRLYISDERFGRMFARVHEQLNSHFVSINDRAKSSRHYWAESSRDLLSLIEEIDDILDLLRQSGITVDFSPDCKRMIDRCTPWLQTAHGSAVPEDFEPLRPIKYKAIFTRPETEVSLANPLATQKLELEGEGAYALVYSFEDPNYGIRFALKRAKKGLDERDLARFNEEFRILKSLSFPYLVEVYKYNQARNEYTMEYCPETLRSFVAKRNASLTGATRRRIALQFLYGINYLHHKGYLHRDVSLQNVLLRVFDSGAVLVKLSDFGLAKDQGSSFTRTQSEIRGTILDPLLQSFKSYDVYNEVYAVGFVLSYIFTGRESIRPGNDSVGKVIRKCTTLERSERYSSISAIISDVEQIPVSPSDASA